MGTTKRERQKEGRQARLEEEAAAQAAASRRRAAIRGGIALVVILVGVFIYSLVSGNDDEDAVSTEAGQTDGADDTTNGAADDSTNGAADDPGPELSTAAPELDSDGNTPCPAETGQERFITFDGPMANCLEEGATYTAVITTSEGEVTIQLDSELTPNTTNNFVALARYGYYDGTDLFRTDPSIAIIQGGSPHTNSASDPGPGYNIPDEGGEFSADSGTYTGPFTYEPGQLVMARSAGPDSSGAQFFFTVGQESALLDSQGTYLSFGDVVGGMGVLEAILDLHQPDSSGLGGSPSRPVTIQSIVIEQS